MRCWYFIYLYGTFISSCYSAVLSIQDCDNTSAECEVIGNLISTLLKLESVETTDLSNPEMDLTTIAEIFHIDHCLR